MGEEREEEHSKQLASIDTSLQLILYRIGEGDKRFEKVEKIMEVHATEAQKTAIRLASIEDSVTRHQTLINRIWLSIATVITAIFSKLGYDVFK